MNNPVLDAIRERRSIRRYTQDPVDPAQLLQILEAGRFAPSGKNNQPWRILEIQGGDPRQETLAGLTKYAPIVREGRALIAVFLDKTVLYSPAKDQQSLGACAQNMLLAAHSLGLGALWLGEIINQEPEVTRALRLPDERYELACLLVLGHPAQKGGSSRRPLSDLLLEPFPNA